MTEVVKKEETGLAAIISEHQDKFLALMEKPQQFERMKNLFLSQVNKNPKLRECSPASLLGALAKLATYNLDLTDENSAYLMPIQGEASLMLSYKALMQIAYNKGAKRIDAQIVFKDDDFDCDLDKGKINKHKPGPVRDEPVGVYGIMEMSNGSSRISYLSWEQIKFKKAQADEKTKNNKYSKSDYNHFWKHLHAMAKKVAIREVLKLMPQAKITYIDAPEVEIGRSQFGLQSNDEIYEAETAELGLE